MEGKTIIIILILLLIIGFYGGYQTKQAGYSCDIGVDETFCLWWHQTEYGKFIETLEEIDKDLFGG